MAKSRKRHVNDKPVSMAILMLPADQPLAKQLYELLKQFLKESRHGGPQLFFELLAVIESIQREVPDALRDLIRSNVDDRKGEFKAKIGDCRPWLSPLTEQLEEWLRAEVDKLQKEQRPPTMVNSEQFN